MDHQESKKAAKAFVDKYFPVKQPEAKFSDVLSDLFPPPPPQNSRHQVSGKKPGNEGGSNSAARNAAAAAGSRSHGPGQKKGDAVVFCEVSDPCSMSSSVDYGCRDNYYPSNAAASAYRHPGSSYDTKDANDNSDYPDPKHSRGEWWQGSLYY